MLQTNWVNNIYYDIEKRSISTMKNNDSFIYCNLMGPIQGITILQVVLQIDLSLECESKSTVRFYFLLCFHH